MELSIQESSNHQFIYDVVPFLKHGYSNFELNFNSSWGQEFTHNHMSLPIIIVGLYLSLVYGGSIYMKNKPKMDLRYTLATWNGMLSLFSFCGAMRTVPELLHMMSIYEPTKTICMTPQETWGTGASGLWVQMFVFSKIPELLDTYFIVARGKPLIFLHWYHHVTVLLYCWHSFATFAPQALYFVAMNYTVHAIMYGYYCLSALKLRPPWLSPFVITCAQISQMFVGVTVQLGALTQYYTNPSCKLNRNNIGFGTIMYASYFALFTHFAIKRYHKPNYNSLKNIKSM